MSAAKRSRQRPAESPPARSYSQPASKRIKSSHVPLRSGLDFLVDEDARAGRKIEAKLTNGVSRSQSSRVDHSHAIVAHNSDEESTDNDDEDGQQQVKAEPDIIAISSGEEDSSELEEEEEGDEENGEGEEGALHQRPGVQGGVQPRGQLLTNGHISNDGDPADETQAMAGAEDVQMEDAEQAAQEGDEPTFGDLLRVRHLEPIDLQNALRSEVPDAQGLIPTPGQSNVTTGHSLGTLLSQALKTNDKDMLEKCLAWSDPNTIRATVQRQTSQEIARLLERIAERVYQRPGRAGSLMTWVQWSLVCHGGYIAHQPELMRKLRSLAQVLQQRAQGLQALLHLKGKLDLLAAQLELRRSMQQTSQAANMENQDDEDGVLYIEGRDDDWSSDNEAANDEPQESHVRSRRDGKLQVTSRHEDVEDEDIDAFIPNGVSYDDDDSSAGEDEEDDEPNGMQDVEAQEGSEDEDEDEESSNEELESEISSADEDSSDEEAGEAYSVKQAKPSTLNRKR